MRIKLHITHEVALIYSYFLPTFSGVLFKQRYYVELCDYFITIILVYQICLRFLSVMRKDPIRYS